MARLFKDGMRELCKHCGERWSKIGVWCQVCIEAEWPYAPVGDGEHWIVWKVAWRRADNLFIGAFGAAYEVGEVTAVWAPANWLLSPLGALKEVAYGNNTNTWERHRDQLTIIAAVGRVRDLQLQENQVLRGLSPALTLAAWPLAECPLTPHEASDLLLDVNGNSEAIDAWECTFRPALPTAVALPPAIHGCQAIVAQITRDLRSSAEQNIWYDLVAKTREIRADVPIQLVEIAYKLRPATLRAIRQRTVEWAERPIAPTNHRVS